jgi:hypothetical protein
MTNKTNPTTTIDCTNQFSIEDCGFDKLLQFHQSSKAICLDLYHEEYKMYSPLCMTATLTGVLADIMKSEVIEYFIDLTSITDYVNGIPSDPFTLEAEEDYEGEEEEEYWEDDWEDDPEEEDPLEDEEEEDICESANNFLTLDDFIETCLGDDESEDEDEEEDDP